MRGGLGGQCSAVVGNCESLRLSRLQPRAATLPRGEQRGWEQGETARVVRAQARSAAPRPGCLRLRG